MNELTCYYGLKELYGEELFTDETSLEITKLILLAISFGYIVEVDFKEIKSVKNEWLTNSFGLIIKEKGYAFLIKNVKLLNLSEGIKAIVAESIAV